MTLHRRTQTNARRLLTVTLVAFALPSAVLAEDTTPVSTTRAVNQAPPEGAATTPEVRQAPAPVASGQTYVYDQKAISGRPTLVTPDQARAIVEQFRGAYATLGSPRLLVYVNRELVDEQSGMVLTGHTERYQTTRSSGSVDFKPAAGASNSPSSSGNTTVTAGGSVIITNAADSLPPGTGTGSSEVTQTSGENTYQVRQAPQPTLVDRQTTRDIERLFGRPLRLAGATLADQRVGAQLIGDKPLSALTQPGATQASRDREALMKHADVVLEILIGTRAVSSPGFEGAEVSSIPDIQATAIRLSDARILAQATSSDVLGPDRSAGAVARKFDVREIAEATALALMQDMTLSAPQPATEAAAAPAK